MGRNDDRHVSVFHGWLLNNYLSGRKYLKGNVKWQYFLQEVATLNQMAGAKSWWDSKSAAVKVIKNLSLQHKLFKVLRRQDKVEEKIWFLEGAIQKIEWKIALLEARPSSWDKPSPTLLPTLLAQIQAREEDLEHADAEAEEIERKYQTAQRRYALFALTCFRAMFSLPCNWSYCMPGMHSFATGRTGSATEMTSRKDCMRIVIYLTTERLRSSTE